MSIWYQSSASHCILSFCSCNVHTKKYLILKILSSLLVSSIIPISRDQERESGYRIGITSSGSGEYLMRKQLSCQMCQRNQIMTNTEGRPITFSFLSSIHFTMFLQKAVKVSKQQVFPPCEI